MVTEPPLSRATVPLQEIDRRIARFVWLERRRFELLGGWTASTAELQVKAMVATQSHHHACHASLWEGHLPHRSGHDPSATAAVDAGLAGFIDAVRDPEATLERLVGAYRVLAVHAIAAYSRELERSTALSDAAVARTCRLVLADQLDGWRHGEMALQSLLGTEAEVSRAGAHQARLERLLVGAGGYVGTADDR